MSKNYPFHIKEADSYHAETLWPHRLRLWRMCSEDLIDAVAFIRNPENKADVMKILAKGMRLPRVEDAEEGYQSMVGLYEKKLYPSVQGIRNVIRLLGTTNEKIRRLKAEDLVDDSVVRKLEKDGRF